MKDFNSVDNIRQRYIDGYYKNQLEYPAIPRFKEGHIFDEEKSARWNREECERQIEEARQKRKKYNEESARMYNILRSDTIEAIMNEYGFNEKQAAKIYDYAYNEKHSHMSDVFYYIDEICGLFKEIQKM